MNNPRTNQDAVKLGAAIREARLKRQLTLPEAASLAEIDKGTWWRIEAGQVNPSIQRLRVIARTLRVPPGSLLAA